MEACTWQSAHHLQPGSRMTGAPDVGDATLRSVQAPDPTMPESFAGSAATIAGFRNRGLHDPAVAPVREPLGDVEVGGPRRQAYKGSIHAGWNTEGKL